MARSHSPLPWRVEVWDSRDCGSVLAGDQEFGCIQDCEALAMSRADAELIVRAVNSHADLLAALKAVTNSLEGTRDVQLGNDPDGWHAVQQGRAAIRKAEGE